MVTYSRAFETWSGYPVAVPPPKVCFSQKSPGDPQPLALRELTTSQLPVYALKDRSDRSNRHTYSISYDQEPLKCSDTSDPVLTGPEPVSLYDDRSIQQSSSGTRHTRDIQNGRGSSEAVPVPDSDDGPSRNRRGGVKRRSRICRASSSEEDEPFDNSFDVQTAKPSKLNRRRRLKHVKPIPDLGKHRRFCQDAESDLSFKSTFSCLTEPDGSTVSMPSTSHEIQINDGGLGRSNNSKPKEHDGDNALDAPVDGSTAPSSFSGRGPVGEDASPLSTTLENSESLLSLPDEEICKPRSVTHVKTYIPTQVLPDGSYTWVAIRLRKPRDAGTDFSIKNVLQEPWTESSDVLSNNENSLARVSNPPASRNLSRGAHWAYVDDTLCDVAGFDEELKLPSTLARDVRYLQNSFFGIEPPDKGFRYNEDYAFRREASLTSRRTYFLHPEMDFAELRSFNINAEVEEANATPSSLQSAPVSSSQPDGQSTLCKEPSLIFYSTATSGLTKTDENRYRLWGQEVKEGDMIQVLFLDCAVDDHCVEEEEFQLFRLQTLEQAFSKACDLSSRGPTGKAPNLTTVHLARYAPTMFWNLVFQLESDPFQIRQFLSRFTGTSLYGPLLRTRRSSNGASPSKRSLIDAGGSSRTLQSKRRSRSVQFPNGSSKQSNTFTEEDRRRAVFDAVRKQAAQRVFLWNQQSRRTLNQPTNSVPDTRNQAAAIQALPTRLSTLVCRTLQSLNDAGSLSLRRERRIVLPDDPVLLVETYLDADGFPKQSLAPMTLYQRRLIYGFCCLNGWTAPLEIRLNEKGRAVYAAKPIEKDDFICEYAGEFIQLRGIAQLREAQYEAQGLGSYMFYFKDPYSDKMSCIDATAERVEYGPARFINHSHLRPNCYAMVVRNPMPEGRLHKIEPKLVFLAKRFIQANEELLIDYGETNPKALEANPWLVNT